MAPVDWTIVVLGLLLPVLWFFRESLPIIGGKPRAVITPSTTQTNKKEDEGDPRDFVAKMQRGVS